MRISIITATYNSAHTLPETLESIANQSYKNIEHIIVDGGSTDGTVLMAEEYARNNPYVKIISEKDNGLYHAMNKGIALARGDIIHILNSDDFYESNSVLGRVAEKFESNDINACYGDLLLVKRNDISKITRLWRPGVFDKKNIDSGWSPPHPALFVKNDLYKTLGDFSLDFAIASDYDFMFRLMKYDHVRFGYIPDTLVRMRDFGISGNSIGQRLKGWRELKKSWARNGYAVPRFFIARRILSKLPQYLLMKNAFR